MRCGDGAIAAGAKKIAKVRFEANALRSWASFPSANGISM
jgi:hypothetical protein